ncbi:HAD family hydrolase [Bacillus sp. AL-1R]
MIRAVVFDMDDTLYEEKEYVISGFRAVDKWVRENYGIFVFFDVAKQLFESGETKKIFNKALELLNLEYDEKIISKMLYIYRTHEPEIQLLKEAEWVFSNLKDSVRIGLISDGFIYSQKKKVTALKLDSLFHSIILSDHYGRENWKPSSIPYEKAIQELNCNHFECVYIGDNLQKDFITAKKLGWLTVHINRSNGIYNDVVVPIEYEAHFQVDNLMDLSRLPMLKQLFKSL